MNISFKGVEGIKGNCIYPIRDLEDVYSPMKAIFLKLNDEGSKDLSEMDELTKRYPRGQDDYFTFEHALLNGSDTFFVNGHMMEIDKDDVDLLKKLNKLLTKTLDEMPLRQKKGMDFASSIITKLETFAIGIDIKQSYSKILGEILKNK